MRVLVTMVIACTLVAGCGSDEEEGTCTTEMFEKYGAAGFAAVTDNILTNIGTVSAMNPSPIGDSFKGLTTQEVATVEANLEDLLIQVYGGPQNYTGRDMTTAHTGLGITSAQYDAFIGMVVVPALTTAGVPSADITNCFAPPVTDATFKASIVGK